MCLPFRSFTRRMREKGMEKKERIIETLHL
jgi:hypothetical protein